MKPSIILMSTPFLAVSIILDAFFHKHEYGLKDTINNINTLLIEELGALPVKCLILFSYIYISEHHPLLVINPHAIGSWFLLWIGVDFCYYWFHRASHRCTLLWIGHSVHHQSTHFNLSVALRQGLWQTMTSWVFFLPLAWIGFPAWMFFIVYPLNTLYQFGLHTTRTHRIPYFETIFNTPSHHRVHHGINPQYIDKNYGGSLIIWDRMFGTFEPEADTVTYGVTEPLSSWNPFYAQIKVLDDLYYYGSYLKHKGLVLLALLMPPEWILNKLHALQIHPKKPVSVLSDNAPPKRYLFFNLTLAIMLYWLIMFTYSPENSTSFIELALAFTVLLTQGSVSNGNFKVVFPEYLKAFLLGATVYLLSNMTAMALVIGVFCLLINRNLLKNTHSRTLTLMPEQEEITTPL